MCIPNTNSKYVKGTSIALNVHSKKHTQNNTREQKSEHDRYCGRPWQKFKELTNHKFSITNWEWLRTTQVQPYFFSTTSSASVHWASDFGSISSPFLQIRILYEEHAERHSVHNMQTTCMKIILGSFQQQQISGHSVQHLANGNNNSYLSAGGSISAKRIINHNDHQ